MKASKIAKKEDDKAAAAKAKTDVKKDEDNDSAELLSEESEEKEEASNVAGKREKSEVAPKKNGKAEVADEESDKAEKEAPAAEEEKAKPAEATSGAHSEEVELFIGNLPFSAGEDQISDFFGKYGEVVSVKLIQRDGRPSGRGFVKFASPASAAKAVAANGQDFEGRPLIARYASEPAPERKPFGSQGQGQREASGTTVFIGGLSYQSSQDSVQSMFSPCGSIVAVRVATDPEGNPRGFAHVEFDSEEGVKKALELSGQELDGRRIRVDVAGNRPEKSGGHFGGNSRGRGGFGGGRGRGGFGGRGGRGGFRGGRGGYGGDFKRGRYDD